MGKSPLYKCIDFVVYYGQKDLKRIKGYDIVVVEPSALSQSDLTTLKSNNKYIFSYLSIMEVRKSSEDFELLNKEDLLKNDNGIVFNREYETYLVDLSSKIWIEMLFTKVKSLYMHNYDGLFLDTLGDIYNFNISTKDKNRLILKSRSILSDIKSLYPNFMLIQNNAIELTNYTIDNINAICWENPPLAGKKLTIRSKSILAFLRKITIQKGIPILILTENLHLKSLEKKYNKTGFLFYNAPKNYLSLR